MKMSSPVQVDEDKGGDVEFVSEGPLRPVLDCIDLLSDSEDEGCSYSGTIDDEINRQRAHVTSTLDRLAHQVDLEKRERADRCKAFKEKQNLQRAHGQQELAFSSGSGVNQEAKRCVDMWLKMPGLRPGVISSGSGRRQRNTSFPNNWSTKHTCPVINCGRVYDNASLLAGHLKRFDHSPCDPAICLKGSPAELFACVTCCQRFHTEEAWRKHLEDKVSSSQAEGHSIDQAYQQIVCFACPACYLLFNLRDECLQHMSAKNHFTETLTMSEPKGRAMPVPIPQYAKNRLIALCKDVVFNVRCSLCHKVLTSHQAAQAHFNVHCREGCAVAKAEKKVVQVMKQLQVRGQCSLCCLLFLSQAEIDRHKESTQHDVEVNHSMEKALLQYCKFGEIRRARKTAEIEEKRRSASVQAPPQKRSKERRESGGLPTKRQKLSQSLSNGRKSAWFCECGLQFTEEATATTHLLAINQIFHQCGVCAKLMGESSIARLHMSRFHGGAHLSNFLFYCRKCKLEMPRFEDALAHVSEAHSGHTYFAEQEVPEEATVVIDSVACDSKSSDMPVRAAAAAAASSSKAAPSWMCRMCEDIFDSEAAVRKHCGDLSAHSFQRFVCGHCPQKFFKESTVRRHCVNEHDGQIESSHFCGLCDSMPFESEGEFMEHYKSLHSKDYFCMEDAEVVQPSAAENGGPTCPCMGSEKSKEETKATYTQCMRSLSTDGKCQYVCAPCSFSVSTYAQIKTHVHTKHTALKLDKTFDVECCACQETFVDVPGFHKHHHAQHCTLEPCVSARNDTKAKPTATRVLDAEEIKAEADEIEDEALVKFLNMEQGIQDGNSASEDESDDEMKRVLALSAEENKETVEFEEALKRSLVEY